MASSSRRMLQQQGTATFEEQMKTSWPEVVGMGLFPAAIKIHGDRPDVGVEPHKVGAQVPPGYDPKRVRVFVNSDSILSVAQTPVVG